MNKIKIELIYILLLFIGCASTQNLTNDQAIDIAEKYVVEQCYSDEIINLEKIKIDPDILDQYQTPEKVSELRHNLLDSKSVYSKKVEHGWIIGFKYKDEKFNEIINVIRFGKGVWVSENGKEIKMFHENIGFK